VPVASACMTDLFDLTGRVNYRDKAAGSEADTGNWQVTVEAQFLLIVGASDFFGSSTINYFSYSYV